MATKTKDQNAETATPAEDIDPGPLSFSDISPEDMMKSGGSTAAVDTRFDEVLKNSFETDTPKQFTVPEPAAKKTMNALRSAASRLNIGVKVRHATKDGQTTIQFLARERQWRKAPGTANDSGESAPNGE